MSEGKFKFTRYQVFVLIVLAFLQFSVVLDFMILSPLGYILMPALKIDTKEFGLVVAAYAFSAFVSAIVGAVFAVRFDRKKLLLFFYAGFIVGTFLCGIANTFWFLLLARIVTGLFGGVLGSLVMSIVTDLFPPQVRGRVMGIIQMAFAASQILGIYFGLKFAQSVDWHLPFIAIVVVSLLVFVAIFFKLKPINEHLKLQNEKTGFSHLGRILAQKTYLKAFLATTLLATGGYMLMPFGSDYAVHNLGIEEKVELPLFYLYTGLATFFVMPIAGILSDKLGRYKVFFFGSALSIIMLLIYCNLSITPFWQIVLINIILFMGIMSRIAPSQAIMSMVPEAKDRGAFMSINAAFMYLSGGVSSMIAGLIVLKNEDKTLGNYDLLGYVVSAAIVITLIQMYFVSKMVNEKQKLA